MCFSFLWTIRTSLNSKWNSKWVYTAIAHFFNFLRISIWSNSALILLNQTEWNHVFVRFFYSAIMSAWFHPNWQNCQNQKFWHVPDQFGCIESVLSANIDVYDLFLSKYLRIRLMRFYYIQSNYLKTCFENRITHFFFHFKRQRTKRKSLIFGCFQSESNETYTVIALKAWGLQAESLSSFSISLLWNDIEKEQMQRKHTKEK